MNRTIKKQKYLGIKKIIAIFIGFGTMIGLYIGVFQKIPAVQKTTAYFFAHKYEQPKISIVSSCYGYLNVRIDNKSKTDVYITGYNIQYLNSKKGELIPALLIPIEHTLIMYNQNHVFDLKLPSTIGFYLTDENASKLIGDTPRRCLLDIRYTIADKQSADTFEPFWCLH